jgi:DNA-binding NarL/FixJ family response regulator
MRVLIVDDQRAVRKSVRRSLGEEHSLQVVGEASNGEEAIQQTKTLKPELIIMDISMPVMDGLTAAELIKKFYTQTMILMHSMYKLKEFIETAKSLGLQGYVSKEENGPALLDAVHAMLRNQTYFPV